MSLTLVVGDKRFSSWSLRGWLVLSLSGSPFREIPVRLAQADTRQRLLEHSPSGKVPVLLTESGPVWDSLAIAEYLAERFPEAYLWPRGEYARALARSVCAEMHSGFTALRTYLPMDLQRDQAYEGSLPLDAQADIERVCELWADCRSRFGADGPFLFGRASVADAFYAPVAARLRTYRVELPELAAEYVGSVYRWPAFEQWFQAALAERGATD